MSFVAHSVCDLSLTRAMPKRLRDFSIALSMKNYTIIMSCLRYYYTECKQTAYQSWHVGYGYAFSSKVQVHHKYGGYGRQNTEDDYKDEINTCANITNSLSSHHQNLIGQAYSVVQKTGKLIPV